MRFFLLLMVFNPPEPVDHFGTCFYVRFEQDDEPLSVQLYRRLRLLFLPRFSV